MGTYTYDVDHPLAKPTNISIYRGNLFHIAILSFHSILNFIMQLSQIATKRSSSHQPRYPFIILKVGKNPKFFKEIENEARIYKALGLHTRDAQSPERTD